MQKSTLKKDIKEAASSRIGGLIVCLIASYSFAKFLTNTKGQIICGIIILALYSLPIYGTMWQIGSRDSNLATHEHKKRDIFYGFKVGLITSIPWFVMGLIIIISKIGLFPYNIMIAYKIFSPDIIAFINLVNVSASIQELSLIQVVIMALLSVVPALLCELYYFFGYKGFQPWQKIVYKNEDKPKKL